MNYAKPEVIVSGSALVAIQGGSPKQAINADSDGVTQFATPNAYEADE